MLEGPVVREPSMKRFSDRSHSARISGRAERATIVLDKSYLQGASAQEVSTLCDNSNTLVIEDLVFELLTADLDTRTRCFGKIPQRENPVGIIAHPGTLMRYEVDQRQPATPVWEHRMSGTFTFNERLATGDFKLTEDQAGGVHEWEGNLAENVEGFLEEAATAATIFPPLAGLRPGASPERVDEVCQRIATDAEMIRALYSSFAPANFPPAPIVGRTWAVFRRVQAHLLACVDQFARFGVGVHSPRIDRLENERIDINYLVLALLARGLATRDRDMQRRFKLLCPEGLLIDTSEDLGQLQPSSSKHER